MVIGLLAHVTPSVVFSRILRSEALVYKSQVFQNIRIQIPMVSIGISHTVHTFNAALTSGSSLADCGCFSRPFSENVSTTEKVTKTPIIQRVCQKWSFYWGKHMHRLASLPVLCFDCCELIPWFLTTTTNITVKRCAGNISLFASLALHPGGRVL